MVYRLFAFLALFSWHSALAVEVPRERIMKFAAMVMQELGTTPGLAIGVVGDDRVLLTEVLGLRDVEAKLPVTPDTAFYIASSTKSFTAAAVKILAQQGRLKLDAPMSETLPDLRLKPPLRTDVVSLRDLLSHRSGFENGGVNFRTSFPGNMPDQEVLRVLAEYSSPAPITFAYSNVGYIMAGLAIEHATAEDWQEVLRRLVFEPLNMSATTARVQDLRGRRVALSYLDEDQHRFRLMAGKTDETMHPAGGIFSTVADLQRWLLVNLGQGRVGQTRVFPSSLVQALHAQQIDLDRKYRQLSRFGYGLGWYLADYEGDLLIHHFGGFNGFHAHLSFMPARDMGVVVLSNGGGETADTIASFIYDSLLGKKNLEEKYGAELGKLKEEIAKSRAERKQAREKKSAALGQPPGRELGAYAGKYHSDRLGSIDLSIDQGHLTARYGVLSSPLYPQGGDEFLIDWLGDDSLNSVQFRFDEKGGVTLDWGGRLFARAAP